MTPFERGYADYLAGIGLEENPFDADKAPWSLIKWRDGWKAARKARLSGPDDKKHSTNHATGEDQPQKEVI